MNFSIQNRLYNWIVAQWCVFVAMLIVSKIRIFVFSLARCNILTICIRFVPFHKFKQRNTKHLLNAKEIKLLRSIENSLKHWMLYICWYTIKWMAALSKVQYTTKYGGSLVMINEENNSISLTWCKNLQCDGSPIRFFIVRPFDFIGMVNGDTHVKCEAIKPRAKLIDLENYLYNIVQCTATLCSERKAMCCDVKIPHLMGSVRSFVFEHVWCIFFYFFFKTSIHNHQLPITSRNSILPV